MIYDLYGVVIHQGATTNSGHYYAYCQGTSGKWYDCNLWLADADHLKVHGYIGVPLLGKTTTWTRVPDPNQRGPVLPES